MNATDTHLSESKQRELAANVLKQAAQDLRRFYGANSTIDRELYFDAYSWIMSNDSGWPFSFLNVCWLMNLDPEDTRQELLGDLAVGTFGRLARRCRQTARGLSDSLIRCFATERNVTPVEPARLVHTLH